MARYLFTIIKRNTGEILNYSGYTDMDPLVLPELEVLMGIDQSTSRTGIYITDKGSQFHIIGDVFPDNESTKGEFFDNLTKFVGRLLVNCKVKLFVSEKIPKVLGNKNFQGYQANNSLQQLKGVLSTWKTSLQCFKETPIANFDDIEKSSWTSAIIDKSKGKHRFHDKQCVVEDIIDKFPELIVHRSKLAKKNVDSFEACGILYGYMLKKFNPDSGNELYSAADGRQISGNSEYRGHIYVFFTRISSKVSTPLEDYIGPMDLTVEKNGLVHVNYNKDLSLFKNFEVCATQYPVAVTFIDDADIKLTLTWNFRWDFTEDLVVAFIVRKSAIHGSDLKLLKKHFDCEMLV